MIGTYYQLEEVPGFGAPPRLFFDNPSRSFIRRQITYPQPNETVFDNIVVYVKVCPMHMWIFRLNYFLFSLPYFCLFCFLFLNTCTFS